MHLVMFLPEFSAVVNREFSEFMRFARPPVCDEMVAGYVSNLRGQPVCSLRGTTRTFLTKANPDS